MMPIAETEVVFNSLKEIYLPPKENFVCDKGVGEKLFEGMEKWSTYVSQIDAVTGKVETFADLQSKSIRTAQNMQRKGIKPGDVISSLTFNNLDYVATILASTYLGVINAPMDPTTTLIDLTHCLKQTTPKLVFCEEALETILEEAIENIGITTEIVIFGKTDRNTPFSDFLVEREPEESFQVYKMSDPKETAFILFSSGTTGLQKAVCLTHYGLLFTAWRIVDKFNNKKTGLVMSTPFWISNINMILSSIICGDIRVLVKIFDINTTMKYIAQYKIHVIALTPVVGASIIENRENFAAYDFSNLGGVIIGGAKLCPKQLLEYKKIFPNAKVIVGYGMTETAGILLNFFEQRDEDLQSKKDVCIGSPIPGWRYKVIDIKTGEAVGPNQEGELLIKHESVMSAYYKNPKAYADTFDSDGYLKTGDIVYYNEDFHFFYVTRLKDIFKYKGFHISPMVIEAELMKHPNIQEAVVFGVPVTDDRFGELPTAAIIVKDADQYNEQNVINFMKERVPERYQLLGGVYLVEKMPTTSTGKIQRRKLQEMVLKLKIAA